MAVTGFREDFVTFDSHAKDQISGIASGLKVEGEGIVHWEVTLDTGRKVTLVAKALYCPTFNERLLPPRGVWTADGNPTSFESFTDLKDSAFQPFHNGLKRCQMLEKLMGVMEN